MSKKSTNVTLPAIDGTPEEIANAIFGPMLSDKGQEPALSQCVGQELSIKVPEGRPSHLWLQGRQTE